MEQGSTSSVANVLEGIRRRLQARVSRSSSVFDSGFSSGEEEPVSNLRLLLAGAQAAHSRVGQVNPRPPGFGNGLIQFMKRLLRRTLAWYSRPIVEHQALTLEFLGQVTQILEQQQSQLRSLEERIEILRAELADLRQQGQLPTETSVSQKGSSEGS
jgi:hypothetical protein